jgi:mitogen-activated protein kinase kinase
MHRDIKPSNVLVNSRGMIKLCDFGVATETVNSVANTFVGTSTYMAPERIQGGAYTIKSDVWCVGLTVMELAIGRFPFDSSDSAAGDRASAGPMGILDLLQQIVHEPAPKLPKSEAFPPILDDFVAKCLLKNPDDRPTPRDLYDKDNFLQAAKRTPVDLQEWAVSMMERHNRKSYLAPPAPKSLKSDGTSSDTSHTASSASPASFVGHLRDTPVTAKRYASPTVGNVPVVSSQYASQSTPTGIAERSPPPPLSLQHLSLETRDAPNGIGSRSNRLHYSDRDNIPEPASAIEPSGRPMFPPRTSSSNNTITGRNPLASPAYSIRQTPSTAGPPATGPPLKDLPAPPALKSAGIASPRRMR